MLESVRKLSSMGFTLYGSRGTADFYNEHGITVRDINVPGITKQLNSNRIFGAVMSCCYKQTLFSVSEKIIMVSNFFTVAISNSEVGIRASFFIMVSLLLLSLTQRLE